MEKILWAEQKDPKLSKYNYHNKVKYALAWEKTRRKSGGMKAAIVVGWREYEWHDFFQFFSNVVVINL